MTMPQYSLAFDVGQGLPHAIGMNTFLITHGHMDHAAGIPYIISQKAMHSHIVPRFYMPEAMIDPMNEIMNQWSKIEGFKHQFEFIGAKPLDEIQHTSNLIIKTFPTVHRVPSHGYSIYKKHKKLRTDLAGLPADEISKIHARGEEVTEERLQLMVSFTGDTQIEFLDHAPEVKHSKILMLETTYLDDRKTIASAKEWGHTHLDELIPRLDSITSEKIVLIHTSARYSMEEAAKIVKNRLPSREQERVIIFPGR